MPKVSNVPEALQPFVFHGLDLQWKEGDREAIGDCLFCGRDSKVYVEIDTSKWHCKVCGANGNGTSFLKQLWEKCFQDTTVEDYEQFAEQRRLLKGETLAHWGMVKSCITSEWLILGHNTSGELSQLYRYSLDKAKGRYLLYPIPGINHQLFGRGTYNRLKPDLYLCEGPWDGMALWETLQLTKDRERSSVLSIPTCSVFKESWLSLFAGKRVVLCCQNDHPHHIGNGKISPPASLSGMQRIVEALLSPSNQLKPKEICYISWGEQGYNPQLPSGYDLRDILSGTDSSPHNASIRSKQLGVLLQKVQPIPPEWVTTAERKAKAKVNIDPKLCTEWKTLITVWRKALSWTTGLDRALSVMLACITSTKAVGDQLWIRVVSPPSTGKTTLCEALSVCKKYVLAKSTFRGFHSGMQGKVGHGGSLIDLMKDKTLVIKDADTLLTAPNLNQILAEARDLYDGAARSHYRNAMGRDHIGARSTIILCGTDVIRGLDSSELGDRFLDVVVMEGIDEDLEEDILWRVANRAERSVGCESNGQAESHYDPEMVRAMQLTGGYVQYLRDNASKLLPEVEMTDEAKRQCLHLGKFVAYMRARPSKKQEEGESRELAARLVSQHVRLAKCLAVVLNVKTVEIDDEVMKRVRQVALDTARGRTLNIIQFIQSRQEGGITLSALSCHTTYTEDKERALLRFLQKIGAVKQFTVPASIGGRSSIRWKLTEQLNRLYAEVYKSSEKSK